MENHPDRGGTAEGFARALDAYRTLRSSRGSYGREEPTVGVEVRPASRAWYKRPADVLPECAGVLAERWLGLLADVLWECGAVAEVKVAMVPGADAGYADGVFVFGVGVEPTRLRALASVLGSGCLQSCLYA